MEEERLLSKPMAAIACAGLASFYVAILYAPTLVLRLSPPSSMKDFMVRRFICAVISSVVSVFVSALILPMRSRDVASLLGVYGIRSDHIWQAVVFPLSLTCLMYAGSLVLKSLTFIELCCDYIDSAGGFSFECIEYALQRILEWAISVASNVMAWRNYVVAPLTEELVFRACMIPLLLCGGFKTNSVIFLCPVFFSLAHLNHLMEVYSKQNYNLIKASLGVGITNPVTAFTGRIQILKFWLVRRKIAVHMFFYPSLQLGYTLVFGSYASFLFIRTGHLLAPLFAHICCNFMGLPILFSKGKGIVGLAFLAGMVGFLWLLFPMTRPELYNERTDNCRCWHGYCSWS